MVTYDKYYQKKEYFGKPYQGLVDFFKQYPDKGTLCDLGAGQGRDSLALSKMGYKVTAVDHSVVGIKQILEKDEKIIGIVDDVFHFDISSYDMVLLDSFLHFYKKEKEKESEFLKKILLQLKKNGILVNCLLKSAKSEAVLKSVIKNTDCKVEILHEQYIDYPEYQAKYHFMVIKKIS